MKWVFSHRVFLWVLTAQFVSLVGSSVLDFGAAIWLYKQTDSVRSYALGIAFAVLPGILIMPLASRLVDRHDRIRVMAVANFMAALSSFGLLCVASGGHLQAHHIYVAGALSSVCRGLERVAYLSSLAQLLPKERWGHAGGIVNLSWGVAQLVVPPLSVGLLAWLGISGLIWIDLLSLGFAALVLIRLAGGREQARRPVTGDRSSWLQNLQAIARLLRSQPALGPMMGYFFLFNLLVGVAISSVTPLALSAYSEALLSKVLGAAGLGALAGGMAVSWRGVPRRLALGIFLPVSGIGVVILIAGLVDAPLALCVCTFAVMCIFPLVTSSDQLFWQSSTPVDMHGHVFSVREMLASSALPLSALLGSIWSDLLTGPTSAMVWHLSRVDGLRALFLLAGGLLILFGMIPLSLRQARQRRA